MSSVIDGPLGTGGVVYPNNDTAPGQKGKRGEREDPVVQPHPEVGGDDDFAWRIFGRANPSKGTVFKDYVDNLLRAAPGFAQLYGSHVGAGLEGSLFGFLAFYLGDSLDLSAAATMGDDTVQAMMEKFKANMKQVPRSVVSPEAADAMKLGKYVKIVENTIDEGMRSNVRVTDFVRKVRERAGQLREEGLLGYIQARGRAQRDGLPKGLPQGFWGTGEEVDNIVVQVVQVLAQEHGREKGIWGDLGARGPVAGDVGGALAASASMGVVASLALRGKGAEGRAQAGGGSDVDDVGDDLWLEDFHHHSPAGRGGHGGGHGHSFYKDDPEEDSDSEEEGEPASEPGEVQGQKTPKGSDPRQKLRESEPQREPLLSHKGQKEGEKKKPHPARAHTPPDDTPSGDRAVAATVDSLKFFGTGLDTEPGFAIASETMVSAQNQEIELRFTVGLFSDQNKYVQDLLSGLTGLNTVANMGESDGKDEVDLNSPEYGWFTPKGPVQNPLPLDLNGKDHRGQYTWAQFLYMEGVPGAVKPKDPTKASSFKQVVQRLKIKSVFFENVRAMIDTANTVTQLKMFQLQDENNKRTVAYDVSSALTKKTTDEEEKETTNFG